MNTVLTSNVQGAVVASVATVIAMFAAQANAQTSAAQANGETMTARANAETSELPTASVRYGDLDLATTDGAHKLYRRIVLAAEKVCPTYHRRDLNTIARARSCQSDAISRAVRAVNNPQLAAIYAGRVDHG